MQAVAPATSINTPSPVNCAHAVPLPRLYPASRFTMRDALAGVLSDLFAFRKRPIGKAASPGNGGFFDDQARGEFHQLL